MDLGTLSVLPLVGSTTAPDAIDLQVGTYRSSSRDLPTHRAYGVQVSTARVTAPSISGLRLSDALDPCFGLVGTFAWVKTLRSLPRPGSPPPELGMSVPEPAAFAVKLIYAGLLLELGKVLWREFYLTYDVLTGRIPKGDLRRLLETLFRFFEYSVVRRPLFALFDESSKRVVSELVGLPRWMVGGLSWVVDGLVTLTWNCRGQCLDWVLVCVLMGEPEPFALLLQLPPPLAVLGVTILINPVTLWAVMTVYHVLTAVLPLPVAVLVRSSFPLMVSKTLLPEDLPRVGLNALLALAGALGLAAFEGVW
ncbi:hypothetical protein [Methanopyrus sp.]